jgi:hypothetical protein
MSKRQNRREPEYFWTSIKKKKDIKKRGVGEGRRGGAVYAL